MVTCIGLTLLFTNILYFLKQIYFKLVLVSLKNANMKHILVLVGFGEHILGIIGILNFKVSVVCLPMTYFTRVMHLPSHLIY